MKAKIDPAAFLWPFCPRLGRRLAHRGSCYRFHFLNIFLPPPPTRNLEVYFIPVRSMTTKSKFSFKVLSLQHRLTTGVHVAAGPRCAVDTRRGGSFCFGGGGWVTCDICEPQDRWGDAPGECKVYFIILYPIALPAVVSAPHTPPLQPINTRACVYTHGSFVCQSQKLHKNSDLWNLMWQQTQS